MLSLSNTPVRRILFVGSLFLLSAAVLYGKDITGKITYISAEHIYSEPGTKAGLSLGDTLKVYHGSELAGLLVITAISSNSNASTVIEKKAELQVGDSLFISKAVPEETPKSESAAVPPRVATTPQPGDTGLVNVPTKSAEKPFLESSGNITLRYYGVFSSHTVSSYHQPAALVRWSADRIGRMPLKFDIYTRMEKVFGFGGGSRASLGNRPLFRVYNAGFSYGDPESDVVWQFGRIFPREISGVGNIDGALYAHRFGKMTYGVTGGFQPDYYTNRLNTQVMKLGAFTSWNNNRFRNRDWYGALAFVGQYRNGQVDREYLTLNQFYNPFSSLRLSFVGDFALDRTNQSSQVGLITPSNLYFRVNWTALRWLRFSMRYSAQRSIRLFATQSSLPDSLFDYGIRQGVSAGTYINLPWDITLFLTQSYRYKRNMDPLIRAAGAVYFRNLFQSGTRLNTQFAWSKNAFSNALDYNVSLERRFGGNVNLRAGWELYDYTLVGRADPIYRKDYSASATYIFRSSMYWTCQYDLFDDGSFTTQQVSGSLSLNF